MKASIGRLVHYRVGGTDETPELRPALVVRVWSDTCVNLRVFPDGSNDSPAHGIGWKDEKGEIRDIFTAAEREAGSAWKTSAVEGTGIGSWRWPVVHNGASHPSAEGGQPAKRADHECG
jgi:hypothetical protein